MNSLHFNYEYGGIHILTGFHVISSVDTTMLEGYLMLACIEGQLDMDINGKGEHMDTYDILVLPPRTRISKLKGTENVRCDLAIISIETAKLLLHQHIEEWNSCIYLYKSNHIVTTEDTRRQLLYQVGLLAYNMQHKEDPYSGEMLRLNYGSLMFVILGMMMNQVQKPNESDPDWQHKVLFKNFMRILNKRQVKHQPVDSYAKELQVKPAYLVRACKKLTGKTALQWIREYTVADIRYYLTSTDMAVKDICIELGFPNLSFFCRFCNESFGMTPNEYRKFRGGLLNGKD